MERFSALATDDDTATDTELSAAIAFAVAGQPASGWAIPFIADRVLQIGEDAEGSYAACVTAPADDDAIIIVSVNGSDVGTITFAQGDTVGSFVMDETILGAGDFVALEFPAAVDSEWAGIAVTLQANRGDNPGDEIAAVVSFNSRTGVVTAASGDYNSDLVDNASTVNGGAGSVSDALEALGGGITQEQVEDFIAALVAAGTNTGLTVTYVDGTPALSFAVNYATAAEIMAGASAILAMNPDKYFDALAPVTLTDAATIAVDMATFINAKVTLAGNRTLGQPSNAKVGQSGCIEIIQDGTGSRTLAYHADWFFGGGTDPTLTTTAGAIDLLFYQVLSSGKTFGVMNSGTKAVA